MPKYTPEQIYTAARTLLPMLDKATRKQVETLLEQAKSGQDTHLQMLDLITREEANRIALRALLAGEERSESTLAGGYSGLGGEISSTPGQIFVCPFEGCDHRYISAEAGERPPDCPRHKLPLVPAEEAEG
ncbi:MAG: hypothetical protein WHS87_09400 [Anaerolineales bacterium]